MDFIVLKRWLIDTALAANASGHVFPYFASCEAALESSYGTSLLARRANNLFGQKSRAGSPYGVLDLPTKEWVNGEMVDTTAHWISFPDFATCFRERMATLTRLRIRYPHYGNALVATDGETFIREVSQTWSTDPHRADKVLDIYKEFFS
jgi:flagellum-specific peptidoglycan hydrolase FlgJ